MKLAPAITRAALTCALIVAPAATGTAVNAALAAPTQGIVATYDSDANTGTPPRSPRKRPVLASRARNRPPTSRPRRAPVGRPSLRST